MAADFTMPSLGADMDAGTLVEWLVHEGDVVHRGDPMAVVDTDKSAIEVESFDDGVVQTLLVEPGARVAVGTPMARLGPAEAPAPVAPAPVAPAEVPAAPAAEAEAPAPVAAAAGPAPAVQPATEPVTTPRRRAARPPARPRAHPASPPVRHHAAELGVDLTSVDGTGAGGRVTRADVDRAAAARHRPPAAARRVSPYARRLAEELGVDVDQVVGTGPGGAVRADDVQAAAVPAARREAPEVAPAEPAPAAPTPPAPARAAGSRDAIAALMGRAKREIPHYYVATTVDLGPLTDWLRRTNRERPVAERLVPAAALLRATALAARAVPELNGFWVDGRFVPGEDVHLGVAVSVRGGPLVAPAIHGAADLDLPTTMQRLRDLVARARAGRLRRAEMAEPTLTVTDLGDQGVEEVIGVIYPPQVALVGVGRVVERPWAVDGMLGVRPVVRLTLSGDHRATDGSTGARFLATIDRLLQHPEEL
ncbi:2-oxo acid dehydrogenase subunit E2 [Nocardioides sp. WL0053]|uniref:Dihydrolipoamide acetyltransferase component of pyruvate dehydrogenase complex n=1 Tax=Nocardioides jiangsuensis TaxID=2866161 RepID=A0ABS7RKK1_9ACTN|nr:2-oxo acid dehydrogenase subunit E2 [Nocardioides jiangsuensis]MBY9075571.1 2-oxo acid dehydrogenase subunit E2 [Nocardioides jiangsuensis]